MDFLVFFTNIADWFEANIADGLAPMLFAPIQAFIMWTGENRGLMQVLVTLLGLFSPS